MHDSEDIKRSVRERYAGHARSAVQTAEAVGADASTSNAGASSCCGGSSCCGTATSEALGYSAKDLALLPEGADLGLGCGNPHVMLGLKEGETVLDLGSGGGIDCFIAARRVGESGHVIGVDMTPEMLALARRNAETMGARNVEFRLGELEHLPVADNTVDAIISNCVINLVPDKRQAFREAFRVLKPGGRLSVSDIVIDGEVPAVVLESAEAYVACLAGAAKVEDYLGAIRDAGFTSVEIAEEQVFELGDALADEVIGELATFANAPRDELEKAAAAFRSVRVVAHRQ